MDEAKSKRVSQAAAISRIIDAVEAITASMLQGRQTATRTILTLGAGSLVATITVLQIIGTTGARSLWLLPVSWGLHLICIFFCLGYLQRFVGHQPAMTVLRILGEDAAQTLSETIEEMGVDVHPDVLAVKCMSLLLKKNEARLDELLEVGSNWFLLAHLFFYCGLIALMVFASLNLPW